MGSMRCAKSWSSCCRKGLPISRPASGVIFPRTRKWRELIREKALALTREEVPHAVSVEVEEIDEKVVRANLYVETESQKQIVVGKGGSVVKEIGTRARPEIEHLVGPPGLPRAACQGTAEMAQRRAHARAPRDLMIELVYETHSTSTHNEAGIATGWLDGELSEVGRRQAEELGARRRDDGLAVVYTSDLNRAIQTADIAFAGVGPSSAPGSPAP